MVRPCLLLSFEMCKTRAQFFAFLLILAFGYGIIYMYVAPRGRRLKNGDLGETLVADYCRASREFEVSSGKPGQGGCLTPSAEGG